MTKSTTDAPILDDDAVAEIEARANAASRGDWTVCGASWWDGGVQLAGYGIRFDESPDTYTGWDARTNFPPETPEGKQASADRSFLARAREDISALCATVRALRSENERLKEAHKQIQHRCMCCVTNKECSQAVLDIDSISRKALGNQIHGYKVGEIK